MLVIETIIGVLAEKIKMKGVSSYYGVSHTGMRNCSVLFVAKGILLGNGKYMC